MNNEVSRLARHFITFKCEQKRDLLQKYGLHQVSLLLDGLRAYHQQHEYYGLPSEEQK